MPYSGTSSLANILRGSALVTGLVVGELKYAYLKSKVASIRKTQASSGH
eukprot:CAMPEP_0196579954 /NCGR_PEP_ID=MMETSP1081-20130531/25918_1 /TAXON_ID=36882 /ORGANISM="Pyramimonas amylifera, Strain CCMP720" /LENGTH=48 /DNA_ID= /DNA_START= /DNA_END= /DNA_ORIENTATION=